MFRLGPPQGVNRSVGRGQGEGGREGDKEKEGTTTADGGRQTTAGDLTPEDAGGAGGVTVTASPG